MTLKYNRTSLELAVAIIMGILTAFGAFLWFTSLADQRELIAVVAAKTELSAPRLITAADLTTVKIARQALPDKALINGATPLDQILHRSVTKNQILTTLDFVRDRAVDSPSLIIPANTVGFVLPQDWLTGPMPAVKKKDFITLNIAASARTAGRSGTGTLLEHAEVYDTLGSGPSAVLLGIPNNVAIKILDARINQFALSLVVESARPSTAAPFPPKTPPQ